MRHTASLDSFVIDLNTVHNSKTLHTIHGAELEKWNEMKWYIGCVCVCVSSSMSFHAATTTTKSCDSIANVCAHISMHSNWLWTLRNGEMRNLFGFVFLLSSLVWREFHLWMLSFVSTLQKSIRIGELSSSTWLVDDPIWNVHLKLQAMAIR